MFTTEQQEAIRVLVNSMNLTRGRGTKKAACSIAAINLALTGELTDDIPECMSEVIGSWIITTQDALPSQLRNSEQWKFLLPEAAGTGREFEAERSQILIDWFWEALIPEAKKIIENSFIRDNAVFMQHWEKTLNGDLEACRNASMDVYLGVRGDININTELAAGISGICMNLGLILTKTRAIQNPPAGLPHWYKDVEHFRCVRHTEIAYRVADSASILLRSINAKTNPVSLLQALATTTSETKNEEVLAYWQRINPVAVLKKMIDVTRT